MAHKVRLQGEDAVTKLLRRLRLVIHKTRSGNLVLRESVLVLLAFVRAVAKLRDFEEKTQKK